MPFLKNAWYAAGWASEVVPDALLSRRLLGEPVVLFRNGDGAIRAIQGVCPHRLAPLGRGKLVGDTVQCGYHGLAFDETGACVHNPQGSPPKGMKVRPFPVVERHSMVWIWMGNEGMADPGLIPDFSFQDPEFAYVGKGYLNVKVNYELEIENILDLSHIQFLHATTLGSGQVSGGGYEAKQIGDEVWSIRDVIGEIMPHELAINMGIEPGQRADRWLQVRWNAPANMALFTGGVAHGRPRSEGKVSPMAHLFTPETEFSTHYWYSSAIPKSMGPEAAAIAQGKVDWLRMPFEEEDVAMMEEQQRNIGQRDLRSLKLGWLPGDAAGARARKILYAKLDAELASEGRP